MMTVDLPSYAVCRVVGTEQVTPRMRRITVESDALRGVPERGSDQQVKLFFSRDGTVPDIPPMPDDGSGVAGWYARFLAVPEDRRPWMRSYTVRRLDAANGRMWIDFVLHGDPAASGVSAHAGPASRWAAVASEGDVLGVLGPAAATFRFPSGQPGRLLVGDETALPAIGATVEALPAGHRAVVVAEVENGAEEQWWRSAAEVSTHWVRREPGAERLLDAVREAELPTGPLFAWVAGEASAVRAVRRHLVGERGLDKRVVSFSGYWRRHLTQDDDPTVEDVREREELMAEMAE